MMIQIFVKDLNSKTICLHIEQNSTLKELKQTISERININVSKFTMIKESHYIETSHLETATLDEIGINDHTTIHLKLRIFPQVSIELKN
jgi:hypothetical protein